MNRQFHRGGAAACIGFGLAMVLGGCQTGTGPADPPPAPPSDQACNAEGASWAMGQHATDAVVQRARLAAGAEMVRVLRPGEAYTMEFHPDRLNLEVDEAGIIRVVRCG